MQEPRRGSYMWYKSQLKKMDLKAQYNNVNPYLKGGYKQLDELNDYQNHKYIKFNKRSEKYKK